ncbi:MAG: shikimate dehydrogenase, partial [Frankiaceae bacterium]|nr:shikimate dehydrogenase [Frankiaceae bacterium]
EDLAGASLTMPLKQAVLPMLASVEPVAAEVGGANTVVFGAAAGEWSGYNTDVPGMVDALSGLDLPEAATVLGAGATAASAVVALAALGVTHLVVRARRAAAAAALLPLAAGRGLVMDVEPWPSDPLDVELLVSTVPAGAADALHVVDSLAGRVLFDVVYAPWPTPLAAAWSAAGGTLVGGLELLIAQAAHQVKLMTGKDAPLDAMRAAVRS